MAEDLESSHGSRIEGREMSEVFQVAEKRVDMLFFDSMQFSIQFKAYNMQDNPGNVFFAEKKGACGRIKRQKKLTIIFYNMQ